MRRHVRWAQFFATLGLCARQRFVVLNKLCLKPNVKRKEETGQESYCVLPVKILINKCEIMPDAALSVTVRPPKLDCRLF